MNQSKNSTSPEAKVQTVAVIGAGIIGINCALELQSRGYNVTLFDKQGIGEGCSKGNAGHFATEQVFPLAQASMLKQLPKMLLDPLGPVTVSPSQLIKALPWFLQFIFNMRPNAAKKSAEALKALNLHAIDYYKPLLKAANCEELLENKGALLVFEGTPLPEIKQTQQRFQDAGVNVSLYNQEQCRELEPELSDNIKYALFFPDVGHTIEPHQLCFKLTELANEKGMQYLKGEVNSIEQSGMQVHITSDNQTLIFDHAVVASGAWSKPLLKQLGYHLPMQAERGYHVELAHHNSLSRPVTSSERKFIMTPMANGLRLAGTVEYAALTQNANYQRAQPLLHHAKEIINNLPSERNQDSRWMGPRPSLPDSLPVICQATNHDHIYFAVGHHHLGLTQGAITAKLIGQLMDNQATDIDVSPYDISRFN
ncbi:FAD-binding oxidoreductase [Thalassotalea sp. M1531]|uniref:FAD-binding oxidoreductase n=1 Tax=Thalassotalea algicola TaxID=2716224 RepID=A0A7Y0Q5Z6_9GAMM|nr:FAD-dependent oxidoreductase [Thalassotalea algicola]NMP30858.1 FAD-binding oxidoreductase [Thalassotalea algicola]